MARAADPDAVTAGSNGLKSLTDGSIRTGGIVFAEPKAQTPAPTPALQPEAKIKTVVSLGNLGDVSSKAGFNMTTNYDDAKTYKLKEYLTARWAASSRSSTRAASC